MWFSGGFDEGNLCLRRGAGEGEDRVSERLIAIGSMIGLLILMVLIFAAAYAVTRFLGRQYAVQTSPARAIKVIDKLVLGKDSFLLIVEAGEKTLLLGAGPQRISTLAELDGEMIDSLPPAESASGFFDMLTSRINRTRNIP